MKITVRSTLPIGAGLGSSAAYAVCLAAGLLSLTNNTQYPSYSNSDLQLINSWAFEAEKIMHGNPSGVDNSVSVFGGILRFRKAVLTPLQNPGQLRILLVNTQVSRSTKALVAKVRSYQEQVCSLSLRCVYTGIYFIVI